MGYLEKIGTSDILCILFDRKINKRMQQWCREHCNFDAKIFRSAVSTGTWKLYSENINVTIKTIQDTFEKTAYIS